MSHLNQVINISFSKNVSEHLKNLQKKYYTNTECHSNQVIKTSFTKNVLSILRMCKETFYKCRK